MTNAELAKVSGLTEKEVSRIFKLFELREGRETEKQLAERGALINKVWKFGGTNAWHTVNREMWGRGALRI